MIDVPELPRELALRILGLAYPGLTIDQRRGLGIGPGRLAVPDDTQRELGRVTLARVTLARQPWPNKYGSVFLRSPRSTVLVYLDYYTDDQLQAWVYGRETVAANAWTGEVVFRQATAVP